MICMALESCCSQHRNIRDDEHRLMDLMKGFDFTSCILSVEYKVFSSCLDRANLLTRPGQVIASQYREPPPPRVRPQPDY